MCMVYIVLLAGRIVHARVRSLDIACLIDDQPVASSRELYS